MKLPSVTRIDCTSLRRKTQASRRPLIGAADSHQIGVTETVSPTRDGLAELFIASMPADTNANGDIFGGWLLSQMDIGGGVLLSRSQSRAR